jgi:outer membrane protein OmpA-like peptidoglycan-associated protein
MAKGYILSLVLLLSLPGCFGRKDSDQQSRRNMQENIDVFSKVRTSMDTEDDIELDDEDLDDEYAESKPNFFTFEDEEEALVPAQEGDEYSEDEFPELEELDESDEYSWVDMAADDEFKNVYYQFNHYGISPQQQKAVDHNIEQVKQLLADLNTQAKPVIVLEGHACQEGAPAYNVALSEKRAKSVADLFVAAGVDKNIIKVVGRGQEVPAIINGKVVNGSREDRAPNRRVEVRVIYT